MKLKKNKTKILKLTQKQREIITGLVLGDGHLETRTNGRTYRLKIEHSIIQKDYVLWLYNELKNLIPGEIYETKRDTRHFVGFRTYSSSVFRFYGHQFYPKGKKVIPIMIDKIITPLALAIWFMDDGSKKSNKHKTYNIHTLGFSKKDLERVVLVFRKKFDVQATLHNQKIHYWRIYITSISAEKFKSIIEPYVSKISSMKDKLG